MERPHGDTTTTMVEGPEVLEDGDSVEMTDYQAQWALNNYPDNFEVVGDLEPFPAVNPDEADYRTLQNIAKQFQNLGLDCPAGGTESELRDRIKGLEDEALEALEDN